MLYRDISWRALIEKFLAARYASRLALVQWIARGGLASIE
jgi:hypothetical protein